LLLSRDGVASHPGHCQSALTAWNCPRPAGQPGRKLRLQTKQADSLPGTWLAVDDTPQPAFAGPWEAGGGSLQAYPGPPLGATPLDIWSPSGHPYDSPIAFCESWTPKWRPGAAQGQTRSKGGDAKLPV